MKERRLKLSDNVTRARADDCAQWHHLASSRTTRTGTRLFLSYSSPRPSFAVLLFSSPSDPNSTVSFPSPFLLLFRLPFNLALSVLAFLSRQRSRRSSVRWYFLRANACKTCGGCGNCQSFYSAPSTDITNPRSPCWCVSHFCAACGAELLCNTRMRLTAIGLRLRTAVNEYVQVSGVSNRLLESRNKQVPVLGIEGFRRFGN